MRIRRHIHAPKTAADTEQPSRKVRPTPETKEFKNDLKSSLKDQVRTQLGNLLKDIDSQSKTLLKNRTLDSVLGYKNLVKEFLSIVVKNVYLLKEKADLSPHGKHNVFVIIENVDKTLEELLKLVINKEIDGLKILEKIGEIRGLLIDLYS